jgi:hypothetical protein
MPLARSVRMLGLLLALGVAGSGGGCGPGSHAPMAKERQDQLRESKKTAHRQIREDAKNAQDAAKQQGAMRKGARRGAAGH